MTGYRRRKDGEGFEVPCGEVYRLACCDCGLVHDVVFVSEDGKPIGVAARRSDAETAKRRVRSAMGAKDRRIARLGRALLDLADRPRGVMRPKWLLATIADVRECNKA